MASRTPWRSPGSTWMSSMKSAVKRCGVVKDALFAGGAERLSPGAAEFIAGDSSTWNSVMVCSLWLSRMRKSSLCKVPIARPALSRTTTGTRTRFTLTRSGATEEEEAGDGDGGGICESTAGLPAFCVTGSAGCCAFVAPVGAVKAITAYAKLRAVRSLKRRVCEAICIPNYAADPRQIPFELTPSHQTQSRGWQRDYQPHRRPAWSDDSSQQGYP